uniref:Uncharacterized protein n=1 Tax=Arsenophonus nasoniae TaxID=638 RepID=D2U0A5_9GAMM|nr:hypothetical protein ARN_19180 [Arsenophonus nasoniae]
MLSIIPFLDVAKTKKNTSMCAISIYSICECWWCKQKTPRFHVGLCTTGLFTVWIVRIHKKVVHQQNILNWLTTQAKKKTSQKRGEQKNN